MGMSYAKNPEHKTTLLRAGFENFQSFVVFNHSLRYVDLNIFFFLMKSLLNTETSNIE